MSKIIIRKNICYIREEIDVEFIRALDNELSFRVQGAEHTKAFKGYHSGKDFVKWDGMHRILSSSLTFPRGLLSRVKDFYKQFNKEVTIDQEDRIISDINSIEILGALKKINKYPRDYQFEILEAVKNNNSGVIRAATGSGKSIVAAMMIAYFGKKAIVYVIGKDLLYQTHQFLSEAFNQKIGIIGDGLCDIQDINVASVWTVGQVFGIKRGKILIENEDDDEKLVDIEKFNDIKEMLLSAKVQIFDEEHICSCSTIQEIARNINPEHIYGMSASPWRDDGADLLLEAIFGQKIIDISASRLIRAGYLVKPIIRFLDMPSPKEQCGTHYQTIYKNYVTDYADRNEKVIMGARRLVEQGFQPLVSYTRIPHGKYLYEELSKHLPCMLLSGKDPAQVRLDAKKKIESGEIKCILASTIFDIGVDLPSLSGLVVAGAGKSSVRSLQRVGRVIRPYPGKKIAAVIDFYDKAKFIKQHAVARRKIYSIEEEFDIQWPQKKRR